MQLYNETSHVHSVNYLTGLEFYFQGYVLPPNCIVLLSDIGEESDALFCLTDRRQCCTDNVDGEGWTLPDNTAVNVDMSSDFYLARGLSSLRLNRMSSVTAPTGIFTCSIRIAGSGGLVQEQLYLGAYNNENEGIQHLQ